MSSLFFQHLVSAVSSNSLEALDVTAEQAGSQDGSKHGSEQQPGAAAAAPRPSGAHAAADAVADGNSKLQRNSTNNQKSLEHRLAVHWNWAAASKGAARIGRGLAGNVGVNGAQSALMLQCEHWLEAADPKHRYGTNLRPYFEHWLSELREQEKQQEQQQQRRLQHQQQQQQDQRRQGQQQQQLDSLVPDPGGEDVEEVEEDAARDAAEAAAAEEAAAQPLGVPAALAGWSPVDFVRVLHPTADDSQLANSGRHLMRQEIGCSVASKKAAAGGGCGSGCSSSSSNGAGVQRAQDAVPQRAQAPLRRSHSAPRLKDLAALERRARQQQPTGAASQQDLQPDTPKRLSESLGPAGAALDAAFRSRSATATVSPALPGRGWGSAGTAATLSTAAVAAAGAVAGCSAAAAQQQPQPGPLQQPQQQQQPQKQQQQPQKQQQQYAGGQPQIQPDPQHQPQQQPAARRATHAHAHTHADARFFYWLDEGCGRQVDLSDQGVPRSKLERERVQYLTEAERDRLEVAVDGLMGGLLVYRLSGALVDTGSEMRLVQAKEKKDGGKGEEAQAGQQQQKVDLKPWKKARSGGFEIDATELLRLADAAASTLGSNGSGGGGQGEMHGAGRAAAMVAAARGFASNGAHVRRGAQELMEQQPQQQQQQQQVDGMQVQQGMQHGQAHEEQQQGHQQAQGRSRAGAVAEVAALPPVATEAVGSALEVHPFNAGALAVPTEPQPQKGAEEGLLHYEAKPCKWIYVLDTSGRLYVHAKHRGSFHHSSFLRGGAVLSAGGIVVQQGLITKLTADSGHYRPNFSNFMCTVQLLKDWGADLSRAKLSAKHIQCPV